MNGNARNEGEYSDGGDIWYRANCRYVKTFLDVIEGKFSKEDALNQGLADVDTASKIEFGLKKMLVSAHG